jgi:hypothetical protein
MLKLQSLRGIALVRSDGDWSLLTKIRSLSTLTLTHCNPGLLNSSPFVKELSSLHGRSYLLQEWQRTSNSSNSEEEESKFHLSKFGLSVQPYYQPLSLLPDETRLVSLDMPFRKSLMTILPLCRSLRSLHLTSISEEIGSLSEALLLAPFLRSLSLQVADSSPDLSSLPLSALSSFKIDGESCAVASVAEALTKSEPKSLTNLELEKLQGDLKPLAQALLSCPALTNLSLIDFQTTGRDCLSVVQVLPRLPLRSLTLNMCSFTDESIECLLAFLPQSSVQDLILGTLSPKQLQLLADALPSLSSLLSLEFDSNGFDRCEHESSHLALFAALRSSSLRSLTLRYCSFRRVTFEACLDELPKTQLTQLAFDGVLVFADGFDATIHDESFEQIRHGDVASAWNLRFPQLKDRFCIVGLLRNTHS